MSLKSFIADGFGTGLLAHVHKFSGGKSKHAGVLTLQERFLQFKADLFLVFLNDDFGAAMNQNVAFSGTPEGIHDGGDSALWTGAAVQGTWNFADTTNPQAGTNCVSLTSGNNNDEATFADGTETDMGSFTAITGQLRLETYDATNNSIILQFQNNNVNVGTPINLNDFIDTGSLDVYQGFVIPKANFGLSTETVDEIDISVTRIGGARPTFRIDAWQIEQTGTPAVFSAVPLPGTRFHVKEIRLAIADALAATLADATMEGLAYNQILGVSALSNGITLQGSRNKKVEFSLVFRQLGDFLSVGADLINHISDGTNTFITVSAILYEPIILNGTDGDTLSFTINDNLSGLLQLTAIARGSSEVAVEA